MFNSSEPGTGVGNGPPSPERRVLPTLIVPLITIIIRSLKKPRRALILPKEAGTDRHVDRTAETDPQRLVAVAVQADSPGARA